MRPLLRLAAKSGQRQRGHPRPGCWPAPGLILVAVTTAWPAACADRLGARATFVTQLLAVRCCK
jgi:hypothetical protein